MLRFLDKCVTHAAHAVRSPCRWTVALTPTAVLRFRDLGMFSTAPPAGAIKKLKRKDVDVRARPRLSAAAHRTGALWLTQRVAAAQAVIKQLKAQDD